jgi:hypothetical protein
MSIERFRRYGLAITFGLAASFALTPTSVAQAAASSKPTPASTPVDPSALHVRGLTHLNAGPVQIALEGLTHPIWHCVECDLTQVPSGPCPLCHGPMIQLGQELLCAVVVDPDAGTIRFDVLPGQQVRLTEIQAALLRYKIAFPVEQQFIPHVSLLRVSGPASKEDVAALVAALKASGLFRKVSGSLDAAEQQAELSIECVDSPPRAQVEVAIAQAAPHDKLIDIIWTAGTASGTSRN